MKKIRLPFTCILLLVLFTACKKDYTCKCSDGANITSFTTITATSNSNAETKCKDKSGSVTDSGVDIFTGQPYSTTVYMNCELE